MSRRSYAKAGRGYFGIGIYGPKTPANVGTLYRTACNMGAAFTFVIGARYPQHASDTVKSWRKVPAFEYPSVGALRDSLFDCVLVGVELASNALAIRAFPHPERACYLLGAEDHGLPDPVLAHCHAVVELPGRHCHNVAAAGAMLMYDRWYKQGDTP